MHSSDCYASGRDASKHSPTQIYRTSDVLKHLGVEVHFLDMSDAMVKVAGNGGKETVKKELQDLMLAAQFLIGAEKTRFGEVYTHLENEYISDVDKWPTDLTAA